MTVSEMATGSSAKTRPAKHFSSMVGRRPAHAPHRGLSHGIEIRAMSADGTPNAAG